MENKNLIITNPEGIYDPTAHGYSHVARIRANTDLIYIAGQGGSGLDGVLSNDFKTQVEIVFQNIELALNSEGLQFADVAKLTTLVVDYDEKKHEILTEVSKGIWPDGKFPVNTLIPVSRLALSGMQIEIDATAVCK
ncbi:RidA family protein [Pedobacter sp. AW1-32]|uniref:RidA family protein n=1 Tax=Pedobacter sp. AW1-32 TaxID=3383026 RepID=UPI003FEF96CC